MHVGQVVLGDQCRQAQVDFRATAQRLLKVGLGALADRLDRALEHFHVQGKAHRLDLPALAFAQQLAGAANLQVVGGQHEAGTEVLGVGDRLQAFFGVGADLLPGWRQQVGVGLVVAAANPAAQLVQLGQAELVGTLDDDGVGAGHVDTGFDDGRGHQHVEALVVEVAHHLFQLALAHLPVADADARLWHQFGKVGGAFLDGFHIVVQVVHLATAQQLAQQRLLDRALVLLHDEGAYRQAARRRRGDDRQVAHARHRHVQRTRDRRGGEGEDVDLAAQGLELFFLAHAKAVLFVDDGQAQVLEAYIVLQQLVGADEDVDLAFGQLGGGVGDFLGRLEAAHHLHAHRPVGKAVAEAVVVLLGEQGGGHQYGHLAAAVHGNECRAHGHFGLAEADVAAHQAVHRLGRQHVGAHGFDGSLLVRGFLEREAGAEGGVVGGRVGKCIALARGAAGIDVEQFGGHVAHLFGGLALGFLPGLGAQPVQWCQGIVAAGVAGDQVQVGHRHVELGALGVFEGEELGGLVVDLQGGQAQVAADTVVDMHHRRAFAQLGEVLDHRIVVGVAALVAAPALHHPLTEQRALGDQGNGRLIQQQAFVQRRDGDCQALLAGNEGAPAVDGLRAQLQALEQLQQHFATARRLGGEQHAAGELLKKARQRRQWLVGLGFDGKVGQDLGGKALAADAAVDVILADHHPWPAFQPGEAVFHRQEQLGRRQQWPRRVDAALLVTVAHIAPEVLGSLLDARQGEHLGVLGQVVEQG
ncbi:hypothetical protein D3C81_943950 [compost metagenome]